MSSCRDTIARRVVVVAAGIASLAVCQAAEAQPQTVKLHVDGDAGDLPPPNGIATGQDWGTLAFRFLQDANDEAERIIDLNEETTVQIWVAATDPANPYRPDQDADAGGSGDESSTFLLRNNNSIQLYGGFLGTENDLPDRDPENNTTVLSGVLDFEFTPPCATRPRATAERTTAHPAATIWSAVRRS